jgi:hypothetical protein
MSDDDLAAFIRDYGGNFQAVQREIRRREDEKFHMGQIVEFTVRAKVTGKNNICPIGDVVYVEFEDADKEDVEMYVRLADVRRVDE